MSKAIKLTPRLAAVADLVSKGGRVADIGTDHGYLAVHLVQAGLAERVVAADKNAGPLAAAARSVAEADLAEKIILRQGDGLSVLAVGEVDTICVAGMGGSLIADILGTSREVWQSARSLVLQPMNGVAALRRFVYENAWHITTEKLAAEGEHIYVIFRAEPGKRPMPSPVCLEVGENFATVDDAIFRRYVEGIVAKAKRRADGLSHSSRPQDKRERERVCQFIDELRKIIC